MDYKVVVTAEAEEDLNQFIQYLLFAKKNKQAAKNVLDDFENTIKKLQLWCMIYPVRFAVKNMETQMVKIRNLKVNRW